MVELTFFLTNELTSQKIKIQIVKTNIEREQILRIFLGKKQKI